MTPRITVISFSLLTLACLSVFHSWKDESTPVAIERVLNERPPRKQQISSLTIPSTKELTSALAQPSSGIYSSAEWAHWSEKFSTISPKEASILLGSLKTSVSSLMLREQIAAGLIRGLVKNGYVSEAWDLIDPTFGGIRDGQIRSFFESLSTPGEKTAFFRSLESQEDKIQALNGILESLDIGNLEELSNFPVDWSAVERKIIANRLGGAFDVPLEMRGDPSVAQTAEKATRSLAKLYQLGILNPSSLNQVFEANNYLSAQNIITILDSISADREQKDLASCYQKFIRRYVAEDSGAALESAITKNVMPSLVGIVVSQYYAHDSVDAARWFSAESNRMTPDQYDSGAMVFINQAIKNSEFSAAEAWAATLRSEKQSKTTNATIDKFRSNLSNR